MIEILTSTYIQQIISAAIEQEIPIPILYLMCIINVNANLNESPSTLSQTDESNNIIDEKNLVPNENPVSTNEPTSATSVNVEYCL